MDENKKLIVIAGPTSSGKSALAVEIARHFNGEIISVDSRQIYKGMNIGSGKITKREMRGVPHHLLDITAPARANFSVDRYKKLADQKIIAIEKRGRLPILAGGTGFWIDAVVFNQNFPNVPANQKLRLRLNKLSAEKLFKTLQKLAPARAKTIDPHNKRRLVRAIEIAKFAKSKKVPNIFKQAQNPTHQTLFIGLDLSDKILRDKIHKRLIKRIKQGMFAEVSRLRKNGVSWKKLENFGLEYKFIAMFLRGKFGKGPAARKKMLEELQTAIWHFAKRQRTWLKRNKQMHWLNAANKKTALRQSLVLIKKFIS